MSSRAYLVSTGILCLLCVGAPEAQSAELRSAHYSFSGQVGGAVLVLPAITVQEVEDAQQRSLRSDAPLHLGAHQLRRGERTGSRAAGDSEAAIAPAREAHQFPHAPGHFLSSALPAPRGALLTLNPSAGVSARDAARAAQARGPPADLPTPIRNRTQRSWPARVSCSEAMAARVYPRAEDMPC